jgi:hypothetical protein
MAGQGRGAAHFCEDAYGLRTRIVSYTKGLRVERHTELPGVGGGCGVFGEIHDIQPESRTVQNAGQKTDGHR